jgi:aminopeptidase
MSSIRDQKLAQILLDYSIRINPGERVAIWGTTAAEPLAQALYRAILERGAYPFTYLDLPDQERLTLTYGTSAQLASIPTAQLQAVEEFEAYIKVYSLTDPRALNEFDPERQTQREKALAPLMDAQMNRGASGALKWVATLYPTKGYAREAGLSLEAFSDLFFKACQVDDSIADPVAHWGKVHKKQQAIIDHLTGANQVHLIGPHVDLKLSIKDRKFENASGKCNMPDGEIYTGPVENSADGWVRFTYPAIRKGRLVEDVTLQFKEGRVVKAQASQNEDYLHAALNLDSGARYLGEFAIGLNYQINRFTGNILLDEKIGGTFHLALGAGYPETGSVNKSAIHWDMICDLREDSEIRVDGEVILKNGQILIG